jgi:hypothetical protein
MSRCSVRDRLTITKREITPQGFLVAPAVIGRCGIQPYTRAELGLDGDPDAVVRLMRLPEEVFRPETIASFENVPLTDDHPPDGVRADNWRDFAIGEVRDIAQQDGNLLGARVLIKDADGVRAVISGKAQLSCGYSHDLDMTPGTAPDGQQFDGYQRNILGDHLSIVDSPRGGPICRIGDGKNKEKTMAMKKLAVDGLARFEIEEIAAESIETAFKGITGDRDTAVRDLATHVKDTKAKLAAKDTVIAEKDKVIAAKDKELADVKAELAKAKAIDVDALVTERSQVIADAKKLAPELDPKGTSAQIRRAAITAASTDAVSKTVIDSFVGDAGIEKATDGQIKSAFDLLGKLNRDAVVTAQDRAVAAAVSGHTSAGPVGGGEVFGDEDETTTDESA